ncbi:MAG: U32 family peptidase [Desulfuromonadaceae bacterium]|nr:U32 family peptidase [Desulfuromonadaceae bacterium]
MPSAKKPELLAPAGSLEAFFAALECGADAVYCGPKDFSARAKAKNFTSAELERMTAYAHARNVRLYVTINSLVKERELPALVELLADLEAMGIDAVILQDLAVWRLAREFFPGLKLHASTQLTIHNSAGVRMLERMGFSRVVLARELAIEEIAAIRTQTSLELEHFVHGALCFSFSGQCYFSSYLGGKSGNRGRCAQPCRRLYRSRLQEGYYFSTHDLSAIDLLPELTRAGVGSLKIEGRMKSAEYVANVVAAYRKVLDAPEAKRSDALAEAKELLKGSFGRRPTKGFLLGPDREDISSPSVKGATGQLLGDISQVRGGDILFRSRSPIFVGDRLRVQPKNDRPGKAFTVKELKLGKRSVKRGEAGAQVAIPVPFGDQIKVGDTIFKVSSEQAFTLSDAQCRRRLDPFAALPPEAAVMVEVVGEHLRIEGKAGDFVLRREYGVEFFPARENPLSHEVLEQIFAKTGVKGWRVASFSCGDLPQVVIPPSRLKEIRRDFFVSFEKAWRRHAEARKKTALQRALAALLPGSSPLRSEAPILTVGIGHLKDVHILGDSQVDRILLPLTEENFRSWTNHPNSLRGRENQLIWDLPFILFDPQWENLREMVDLLAEKGFRSFRLNNLGHFPLFEKIPQAQLSTGYRLFSLNSQALTVWKELGIGEATLYIEDDRVNLGDLLVRDSGIATAVTLYASVPLITTRIRIRKLPPGQVLNSDSGDQFRVENRQGLNIVRSLQDFSLMGREKELLQAGCLSFILDLSHCGPFSPQGKKVLAAFSRGTRIAETSLFNYDIGLE